MGLSDGAELVRVHFRVGIAIRVVEESEITWKPKRDNQTSPQKQKRQNTLKRRSKEPLAKLVRQGFSIVWNPYNSVKCADLELHLDGERRDRGQNSLILDVLLPWTQCSDECSWF